MGVDDFINQIYKVAGFYIEENEKQIITVYVRRNLWNTLSPAKFLSK